jgi:hypothetical protein
MNNRLYPHLFVLNLAIFTMASLILGSTPVAAQGTIPISGKYTATYAFQKALPVPDAPDHVIMLVETRGTNINTGPTDFLVNAQVVNREIRDITQGNGPHNGYITFTEDAGEFTAKWNGVVKTTLTETGQPHTTFNGDWVQTHATGRYAGHTASGTYQGFVPSPDKVFIEWEGTSTQAIQ